MDLAKYNLFYHQVLILIICFFALFLVTPLCLIGIIGVLISFICGVKNGMISGVLFTIPKPKASKLNMCKFASFCAEKGYTMKEYGRKFFNRKPQNITDTEIEELIPVWEKYK